MTTPKRTGGQRPAPPKQTAVRHPRPPAKPAPEAKKAKRTGPAGAIDADGLHKSYGDLDALAPLDLHIPVGQRVALVGHNGSGKTTLLRLCSGLMEATSGSVTLMGHAPGTMEARAAVSYLADNPSFYDDLSLWEHLEYTAGLHGCDEHWAQQAADLLGSFGLYERADDRPVTFSRGLKQKAAITMGLIRPLQLLLVDEPFVGLDATGKEALLDAFDEAHAKGVTVVVATHELAFVERVDRLVALREGTLIHDGAPDEIDVVRLVS